MIRHHSSILFAALWLSAAAVQAQQPDTFRLREIVVTATKLPLPRSATTAVVTVLSADSLRQQGLRTVAEALQHTPSAALAQNGGYGAITSLFVRGGESDYVLVLIDGVRVNNPGGVYDFGNLTLDNVDRIEIVRGPVSVLYGSDAVTGVVQIFTRKGGQTSLRARASGGTGDRVMPDSLPEKRFGAGSFSADAGTQWRGLALTAGAGHLTTGGNYAFNNQYRNTTGSLRASLRKGESSELAWTARYTNSTYHYPTDGNGRLVDQNQHRNTETFTTGLAAARTISPRLQLGLRAGLNHSDERYDNDPDSPSDREGSYESHSVGRLRRSFVDASAHLRPRTGSVLTLGGELERQRDRNRYESQSSFGPFNSTFGKERTNRALYGQAIHAVGNVALNGGLRVDDNDRFGTFATWRAGAALQLVPALRVRAAAGTAFKEPTFFENYAEGFTKGNPGLEPEHSRTIEAGIEHSLPGQRGTVQLTAFRQRFRDLIQYVPTDFGTPDPNYRNVAAARADGIELEWSLTAASRIGLTGAVTLLKTEATEPGVEDPAFAGGEPLLRRPDRQATVAASYRFSRLTAEARWTYVGERADLDFAAFPFTRVTLDPYDRIDLSGRWNGLPFGNGALVLNARVENLFDDRYEEILNFPTRGRSLWLGAEATLRRRP